jgi:hypothetical protein
MSEYTQGMSNGESHLNMTYQSVSVLSDDVYSQIIFALEMHCPLPAALIAAPSSASSGGNEALFTLEP